MIMKDRAAILVWWFAMGATTWTFEAPRRVEVGDPLAEGECSIDPSSACVPETGIDKTTVTITAKPGNEAAIDDWPQGPVEITLFSGKTAVSSKGNPSPETIQIQSANVIESKKKPMPVIVVKAVFVIAAGYSKLGDLRVEVKNRGGKALPCSERLFFTVFRVNLLPEEKVSCHPDVELNVTIEPTDIAVGRLALHVEPKEGTFENGANEVDTTPPDSHTLTIGDKKSKARVEVRHYLPGRKPHVCDSGAYEIVVVQVDPVISAETIPKNPLLNLIHNPAGIVINESPGAGTVAVVDTLNSNGGRSTANANIVWTIRPKEDKEFGQGDAEFFPKDGQGNNGGPTVRLNGTTPGRIEVGLGLLGESSEQCEFYEAAAVALRTIPYRVNILTDGEGAMSMFSEKAVADHLRTANIILRQAGVQLVPDPRTDLKTHSSELLDSQNAIFQTVVPTGLTREVKIFDDRDSIKANMNKEVLGIVYIESHVIEARGLTFLRPGNRKGLEVILTYRPTIDHKKPVENVKMVLGEDSLDDELPKLGALFVTNLAGEVPNPGEVLAHEVGHIMSLKHRNDSRPDLTDNLIEPALQNLMHPDRAGATDIDLIQVLAIINSKVFPE